MNCKLIGFFIFGVYWDHPSFNESGHNGIPLRCLLGIHISTNLPQSIYIMNVEHFINLSLIFHSSLFPFFYSFPQGLSSPLSGLLTIRFSVHHLQWLPYFNLKNIVHYLPQLFSYIFTKIKLHFKPDVWFLDVKTWVHSKLKLKYRLMLLTKKN